MTEFSVVIPVRDEEANIPVLVERLGATFEKMGKSFEIVFVTDINHDKTAEVLEQQAAADSRVRALKLSNAFGHHVAVYAGLCAAAGDNVVIMDGDLQDEPEDIPKLYDKVMEGYDVVYGIKDKKNDSAMRNLLTGAFKFCFRFLSDYPLDINTSMYRIVTRRVRDAVMQFQEHDPSLTFIMALVGFPTARVKVASGQRAAGKTKYGLARQFNLAFTSITSFSTRPLRLIAVLGLLTSLASIAYFFVVIVQKLLFGFAVLGWPTIVALITLLSGIQLLALGVTGEYVARVFIETKKRPLFIVEKTIGYPPGTAVTPGGDEET